MAGNRKGLGRESRKEDQDRANSQPVTAADELPPKEFKEIGSSKFRRKPKHLGRDRNRYF
jgi:hypothetical protein